MKIWRSFFLFQAVRFVAARRLIVTQTLLYVTKAAVESLIVTEMPNNVTNLDEQISPQEDLIRRLQVIA